MTRRLRVAATLAVLSLSACQVENDTQRAARGDGRHDGLAGRPTLPEVVETYDALMAELRTALTKQLGSSGWSTRPPSVPTALCQDFGTKPDTGIRTLPFDTFDRFVPEPGWEASVAKVAAVARRYGFSDIARVVDRSDEHRLALADKFGAELTVQDGPRLLSIGLITGCHLRAGPKQSSAH